MGQPILRNGSLWADVFLAKSGASPNPTSPNFDPHSVHHTRKRMLYQLEHSGVEWLINSSVSIDSLPAQDSSP